jgi:hypothetical protein
VDILRSPRLRRALATLTQIALFLPFVEVTDCNTHETTRHFGIELAVRSGWWMFVATAIAIAIARRPASADVAIGDAARALGAALGGFLTLFTTALFGMFDNPRPLIGAWLAGIGWSGLWLATVGASVPAVAREPGKADRGFLLVALLPAALGAIEVRTEDAAEIATDAGLVLLFLVPVLLLGVACSRRAPHDRAARVAMRGLWALSAVVDGILVAGFGSEVPALAVVAAVGALVSMVRLFATRRDAPEAAPRTS